MLATATILNSNIKAQNCKWVRNQTHSIQFNPDFAGNPSTADLYGNSLVASIENYKSSYSLDFIGDFSLKKFNQSGDLLFNKILLGKLLISDVQTDPSGNIYIKGLFMDTLKIDSVNYLINNSASGNVQYYIIKLNSSGDYIWKKNLSVDYPGNYFFGGFKVTGNSLYTGMQRLNLNYIKVLDPAGSEIQSIQINSQSTFTISSIDTDPLGNIIAGGASAMGSINIGGLAATAPNTYNFYIAKLSSSGSGIWIKFVKDITFQKITVSSDKDGNIFASGDLSGSFFFGNIQAQGNQWIYDFFLTKLDPSGNFIWVREVPETATITGDVQKGRYNCFCFDIHGNIYFTGTLRGNMNWGNNVITTASGYSDIIILKYDQNGNVISGKVAGGSGSDRADEISSDYMGNVFISGNTGPSANFDSIAVSGSGNINSFIAKYFDGEFPGTLDLSVIIEGFYDAGINSMNAPDTLRAYIRNPSTPFDIADSALSVIDPITFNGEFTFYNAESGNYYLQLRHRNSLETWSSAQINYLRGGVVNYDFTDDNMKAFGNNIKQVDNSPVRFAIYSGDADQNGYIDLSDMVLILNDVNNFVTGYQPTDINGNNITDLQDLILSNNNSINFIQIFSP
mgnify:CR=1 FL=1